MWPSIELKLKLPSALWFSIPRMTFRKPGERMEFFFYSLIDLLLNVFIIVHLLRSVYLFVIDIVVQVDEVSHGSPNLLNQCHFISVRIYRGSKYFWASNAVLFIIKAIEILNALHERETHIYTLYIQETNHFQPKTFKQSCLNYQLFHKIQNWILLSA